MAWLALATGSWGHGDSAGWLRMFVGVVIHGDGSIIRVRGGKDHPQ